MLSWHETHGRYQIQVSERTPNHSLYAIEYNCRYDHCIVYQLQLLYISMNMIHLSFMMIIVINDYIPIVILYLIILLFTKIATPSFLISSIRCLHSQFSTSAHKILKLHLQVICSLFISKYEYAPQFRPLDRNWKPPLHLSGE